jgi:endonuclease/exonuclease/phosphatase family metal-dependent hydrolase
VRLLTFNTQLLGFYQFKKNKTIRDQNVALLESLKTDIFCFQEFYKTDNPKGFQTLSLLQEQMGPFEVHEKYTHEFVHKQYFGVVTLSRFPIVFRGYIPFEADINNFCIYSDILLPSADTIRVFNAHLASIHFRPDDYAFTRGEFDDFSSFESGFKQVRYKLEEADRRRSMQINRILEEVEKSPYPVIFAGDLNAPPFSNAYYKASQSLKDAFQSGGFGISATYKSKLPLLRIDHVFHDERIDLKRFDRIKRGGSDHYPILIEFDISDD